MIVTDEDSYEVIQSSNGPAVTLDVTVLNSENIQFSIDFVACLAFNSDEWWTSDVRRCTGVWNAIPKPIKLNENITVQQLTNAVQNVFEEVPLKDTRKPEKIKYLKGGDRRTEKKNIVFENENKNSVKVKRPPSCFRHKNPKSKVSGNVETLNVDSTNRNTRSGNWYRRPKRPKAETNVKAEDTIVNKKVDLPYIQKSKWEKPTFIVKENNSDNGFRRRRYGPWCRKTKKTEVEEKAKETCNIWNAKWEKLSAVKEKERTEKISGFRNKSVNRKVITTKDTKKKTPDVTEAQNDSIIIQNPQKNREWICSYAEIERTLLKGTQNMKPLIRIFKKIRDKKQLTNLKSYYIKTIFLHHNSRNGNEYWKQSLAVLFMEMFDVILTHLCEHRLDSFWHQDFNLFRGLRSGQIASIYEQWLKMKKDLISHLENLNPEFIYEVVCTKEEQLLLEQSDSESEFD